MTTTNSPGTHRKKPRQIALEAARNDFYHYYRMVFDQIAPDAEFLDSPHFRVLATAFEKTALGDEQRLLVAIPPRHGKSIIGSVALPAWILGRDPTAKVIVACYGDQLSRDFASRARQLMQSRVYRAIFPDTRLKAGGTALEELTTTKGGYRLATSVQGVVTGKGADIIIVDDVIKAGEANSDTQRNAAYDFFKTTLMSRFDKPAVGKMIVIGQRLHMDDPIGRLRDEGWPILEMPAEGVVEQTFDLGHGASWTQKPGDLLFPERFDKDSLKQLRDNLGEVTFSAQYLQRPAPPGGALFKIKHFQRYEQPPKRAHIERVVQSWDPAFVDNDGNAFSVCTTWAIVGPKLYLLDVFRKRLDFAKLEHVVMSLGKKHKADVVIVESSGAGTGLVDLLRLKPDAHLWLSWDKPTLGKFERAMVQTPKIEKKRVYLPVAAPWLATFEAEVAAFPVTRFTDQVDSMVQFLFALDHSNRVTRDLSAYPEGHSGPQMKLVGASSQPSKW